MTENDTETEASSFIMASELYEAGTAGHSSASMDAQATPEVASPVDDIPIKTDGPKIDHIHGLQLDIVSDHMFEPSRWYPTSPMLCEQYIKFVKAILGRIQANQSNAREVRLFYELLSSDLRPGYWKPVNDFLPELEAGSSVAASDKNEAYLHLLTFLRLEADIRARGGRPKRKKSDEKKINTGLNEPQQKGLAEQVFGKETTEERRTVAQNRLLKSWYEMGYPPGVTAADKARAAAEGREIDLDSLNLPSSVGVKPGAGMRLLAHDEAFPNENLIPRRTAPVTTISNEARPPLRNLFSGYAEKMQEQYAKDKPKLARGYKEAADYEPAVIRGFTTDGYAERQREARKSAVPLIGYQLRERDRQSPYDSNATESSLNSDLLSEVPEFSFDGAHQDTTGAQSGFASASQVDYQKSTAQPDEPRVGQEVVDPTRDPPMARNLHHQP